MAKKEKNFFDLTKGEQLVKAVQGQAPGDAKGKPRSPGSIMGSWIPPRPSQTIKPSVPAKYDKKLGKLVLMDLVEHSKQIKNLVEKGIIPLSRGYVYLDDDAYNTLEGQGLIDSSLNFKEAQKAYSSITKAEGKLFDISNSEAASLQHKLRNEDPFVQEFKGGRPTHLIFQQKNFNANEQDAIKAVEKYLTNNKVTHSANKSVAIYAYFTRLKRDFKPASKSILYKVNVFSGTLEKASSAPNELNYIVTKTNYDIAGELERFSSENFDEFKKVFSKMPDKVAAGHLEAVSTRNYIDLLAACEDLKKDVNVASNPLILGELDEAIELLKYDIEELKQLDFIFATPSSYLHPDLNVFFENLVSGANQLGKGVHFTEVTKKGKLKSWAADPFITFLYNIKGVSTAESHVINSYFKGSRTGAVIARLEKIWDVAAKVFAERLAEEQAYSKAHEEKSPSVIQAMIISALGQIFGELTAEKSIKVTKNGRYFIALQNTYKKSKSINFKLPRKSFKKVVFKNSYKKLRYSANRRQTTPNIVSLINAEIYKYVRAQMSENTLQYRTGEFARSVRVLSAQENAAVQYTYKKNPYSDVFSPGKSYLATEDRNPAKIIDAAIKRLGQDRFQKVFRTEEV